MKYIVYQTINTVNNKIYVGVHKCKDPNVFDGYIGCGVIITNPSTYMTPTTPLQQAVKKYGTKCFKRTLLKIFDNKEDAFNFEKELVDQKFICRPDTYNAKIGGFGGSSYSIEIYQFDLKGVLLRKWPSIIEAAEFYNVSDSAIWNADKFKGSCSNYHWSRNNCINIDEYSCNTGQLCYKYMENGKYESSYNSFPEAAKANNVSLTAIQRAAKGGYKVGSNFYSTELHEVYLGKPKLSLKNKIIYIYNLKGDFITTLNGGKEICKFFNIKSTSSITTALRTERQYKEYQISLEYKEKLEEVIDKRNIKKPVIQYSLTGEEIKVFDSMTAAVEKYGTGVQKVLKGQQKQCKGFVFKYKLMI